jgi:hypothetical protein
MAHKSGHNSLPGQSPPPINPYSERIPVIRSKPVPVLGASIDPTKPIKLSEPTTIRRICNTFHRHSINNRPDRSLFFILLLTLTATHIFPRITTTATTTTTTTTMISFCRFFAPLLVLLTMTVAQEAVNGTGTPDDFLAEAGLSGCMNETLAFITCLTTQKNTTLTINSAISTQCQACIQTKQNTLGTNETEWVGKSCSEVQGSVDDALVECAPVCQLDGCTKEITAIAGCAFVAKVNCTKDGKIAGPTTSLGNGAAVSNNNNKPTTASASSFFFHASLTTGIMLVAAIMTASAMMT